MPLRMRALRVRRLWERLTSPLRRGLWPGLGLSALLWS
jgi:hypothetical protein